MDTFNKDHDVEIIPFDSLNERVTDLHSQYEAAVPFSHVVIDDFINPYAADQLLADFPNQDSAGWIHYKHVNERKLGMPSMT